MTVVARQESGVLDSTSTLTKPHGLGVKPDAVVIQELAPGQNSNVVSVDDTNYKVKFLWHDGKPFKAGTTIRYYVVFVTPAPDPDPDPEPDPDPDPEAKYTTSDKMGSWIIDPADPGGRQVNNNCWDGGAGPQTLTAYAWNKWHVVSNQPGTGRDDGVKTYPDTQLHVSMPVASLTTLNSTFKVAVPSGGGTVPANGKQWNSAFDLWIADDASYGTRWRTEVMVWTNWTANWQYWYGVYNGEHVTFDGVEYAAYHRPATASQGGAMWFIRQDVVNEGSVDLAKLLKWAVTKAWMPSTSVLHEIEYGFEVLHTGEPTKFELLDFTLEGR